MFLRPNERLLDGASSWLNRRGSRGGMEDCRDQMDVYPPGLSYGRIGELVMADGSDHRGQTEESLTGPHHSRVGESIADE